MDITPPYDSEIERSVLGCMLLDATAAEKAIGSLKEQDFHDKRHGTLFNMMCTMSQRNEPIDILTIKTNLRNNKLVEGCGGELYINEHVDIPESLAHIDYYCQIIIEKALRREIISKCNATMREAYDQTNESAMVLDALEKNILSLYTRYRQLNVQPLKGMLHDAIVHIENIKTENRGITGVPAGLDIDQLTAGWQKGDLIVLAARPSMGKTAFALSVAIHASLKAPAEQSVGVAFFSLEMSAQSLTQRLLTMEARVNSQKIRTGKWNADDFTKIQTAAGRLHHANIFIDDTPGINIFQLRSACRRLIQKTIKKEENIGLIIIDYLQLIQNPEKNINSREQEIAGISRSLKSLAKELDIPIIALSQLNRAPEQRIGGNKRPMLSDLRESGSIEQDADVVLFLYRSQTEDVDNQGQIEVIVGKQRNGPTGIRRLRFIKEYAKFENDVYTPTETPAF